MSQTQPRTRWTWEQYWDWEASAFLTLASPPPAPTLVVYGADTPPRSRTEREALAELPGIQSCLLRGGALGIHEEGPDAVAGAVEHFLRVTGGC